MTGPVDEVPPPVRPVRRRWWPVWVVGAWSVVLLAGVFWSVRNDEATVPEQRDIGHAVPELRRATGALVAAAQDQRWATRLGEFQLVECSLNPAWTGRRASRDLTLYVPEGEARAALDGIAAGLPKSYGAGVVVARGGTQLSLFADAGEFIAIDAEAASTDQVLTVRLDSGCRPPADVAGPGDPAAGAAPELFRSTLAALGVTGAEPRIHAETCPAGGTAATFEADGGTADPDSAPRGVPDGTTPIWAGAGGWAYRVGPESVVIDTQGERLVVSVTTGCRAG
ncbi:hypothetical protein AB0F81_10930 [Actinoplanes sp. NPDC024001]|uniref:hypothetical protein n=1 Tax=Actinoplanes sp. NPDC024001 TaxID=3154598 RepID=UPI0033F563B2